MKPIVNRELPGLKEILSRLNGVASVKLAYAAAKSIIRIENEIRDLQEIKKEEPDFIKYTNLLEQIKRKHAIKGPDGQPATRMETAGNQTFAVYDIIPENIKVYQDEALALDTKFKKVIDKQKTKEENYRKLLDETMNVELHTIEPSDVKPLLEKDSEGKTRITGSQFVGLAFLLKSTVTLEMVPEDITASDMKLLIEYFNL
ncbi:MAG: hypothetical protein V2A67_04315 [Bacteroidota bacterium]